MSSLHTISRSSRPDLLDSCISLLRPGDAILFIEDGTYLCVAQCRHSPIPAEVMLYALEEDMIARGTRAKCIAAVELANYSKFVELCCSYDKVVSWY